MHIALRHIIRHRKPTLVRTFGFLSGLLLSGCINMSSIEHPHQIYVLQDSGQRSAPAPTCRPEVLRLANTWSSSFDDRHDLVYSLQPDTRGYYRYAQWSTLPDVRLNQLLFNHLLRDHAYCTLIDARSNADADRTLTTELLAFYHDAAKKPGRAIVRIRTELYDNHSHRLLARTTFTASAPLSQYNAAGAAHAFNLATGNILRDISNWVAAVPNTAPPSAH